MEKLKPYLSLFLIGLLLLIYSFTSGKEQAISLNIHDVYYVMSTVHWYQMYAVFLITIGLIYLILDKVKLKLNTVLSVIHIFGTITLFFVINYCNYRDSLEYCSQADFLQRPNYNLGIINTLLTIIVLQLLFIINIFVSIIKKK